MIKKQLTISNNPFLIGSLIRDIDDDFGIVTKIEKQYDGRIWVYYICMASEIQELILVSSPIDLLNLVV